MAGEKALLEQILKCVHEQSVLAERRHEAQAAFNAEVSQQLRSIREQLDPTQHAEAASAREADAESMLAKVALECGGDISACQEEILANASFLGGDNAYSDEEEEEEEVLATTPPPDSRQHQGQGDARPRLAPQHYLFK